MLRQAEAEAVTATAVATATVIANATATARTAELSIGEAQRLLRYRLCSCVSSRSDAAPIRPRVGPKDQPQRLERIHCRY